MTSRSVYVCDGCNQEKQGVPTADQQYELRDGCDAILDGWSDLRLQDFGSPTRAYFRHYCAKCTRRMLTVLNTPFQ